MKIDIVKIPDMSTIINDINGLEEPQKDSYRCDKCYRIHKKIYKYRNDKKCTQAFLLSSLVIKSGEINDKND